MKMDIECRVGDWIPNGILARRWWNQPRWSGFSFDLGNEHEWQATAATHMWSERAEWRLRGWQRQNRASLSGNCWYLGLKSEIVGRGDLQARKQAKMTKTDTPAASPSCSVDTLKHPDDASTVSEKKVKVNSGWPTLFRNTDSNRTSELPLKTVNVHLHQRRIHVSPVVMVSLRI